MKMRKILSLLLALCLVAGLLVIPASADVTATQSQRWNIMFVVDGSGSLISHESTDPTHLRYQAINSIIDQLPISGNYAGAIVFNGQISNNDSDQAMRKSLALDTGMMPMNNDSDKTFLKNQICNNYLIPQKLTVGDENASKYGTDIGTALLQAQQHLSEMDNGLPGIIFLFTDGKTDLYYDNVEQKSLENKEKAIQNIYNEGIKVCGVFLNKDNKYSGDNEVKDIVARSMGTTTGVNLGEFYVEINDAMDLGDATFAFLQCLNMAVVVGPEIEDINVVSFDRDIRVPGVGVEEINITLTTANGEYFRDDIVVTITKPDGSVMSVGELAAITYSGYTYRVYKLVKPKSGTWNVDVRFPEGNRVGIVYKPTMSLYINSGMEVTPASQDLHVNSTVTINAYLEQHGIKLTDVDSYQEYVCQLTMTNATTGDVTVKEITPDANNNYSLTMDLKDYGIFDVQTAFVCGEAIQVNAQKQTWDLRNHAPVSYGNGKVSEMYGLFIGNDKSVDLADAKFGISDVEDNFSNLTITVTGGTCDTAGMTVSDAGLLEYDASVCGSGSVVLTIMDSQGATTELTLDMSMKSMTLTIILILVAILLVIAIIIIMIIRMRNGVITDGTCAITISVPDENAGVNDEICCDGLTPPGQRIKRKMNLYEVIKHDLDNEHGRARQACKDAGVDFKTYKKIVDDIMLDLKQATVEAKIYKDKDSKRMKSNRILFKHKNVKQLLRSGDSVSFRVDTITVSFAYSASGEIDSDSGKDVFEDDDGFDVGATVVDDAFSKGGNDAFDSFDGGFEDDFVPAKPKKKAAPKAEKKSAAKPAKKEPKKEASFDDDDGFVGGFDGGFDDDGGFDGGFGGGFDDDDVSFS